MLPEVACAPEVIYRGELPGAALTGASAYVAASYMWRSDCERLLGREYASSIVRCSALSADEVAVRWRAEWPSDSARLLEALAGLLGWEVERFDLDATTEATFSWRAIVKLLAMAAKTRCLRLPGACVEGRAVFQLDETGLCVSHRETIDLVALSAASRLRNRRAAANVAEFLDIRRPPQVEPDVWAVEVAAAVLVGVPGAGPLDIDPLQDESEGAIALGAFAIIVAATLAVSARVIGDGTGVFGSSLCDEVLSESLMVYTQCISDVFDYSR